MRTILALTLLLFLISCSKEGEEQTKSSTVSYHVEGTGSISRIQYTVGTAPVEFLYNQELPLIVEVENYSRQKVVEAFVQINQLSDREYIDRIYLKVDGIIVDEASFFNTDELRTFGDGKYSVRLYYEW
ncbi:MAG: hypothetical protein JJ876_04140 [Muricauda sp.]|nr:hypothetical protein [Allomuricauda sp.]MBO6828732.1 hypothetical protein [Allomuricauda sp.]